MDKQELRDRIDEVKAKALGAAIFQCEKLSEELQDTSLINSLNGSGEPSDELVIGKIDAETMLLKMKRLEKLLEIINLLDGETGLNSAFDDFMQKRKSRAGGGVNK